MNGKVKRVWAGASGSLRLRGEGERRFSKCRPVAARGSTVGVRSSNLYPALFESAPVGVGICNYRGEVLACNRRWRLMAGLGPEEPAANSGPCFRPGQRRRFLARLQRDGMVEDWEAPFRRRDGTWLSTLVQMKAIRSGPEELILTTVQDLTHQKRTERHLEGVAALLRIFATKSSRRDYLKAVARFLASWCSCRCVGIRLLNENGQLPFVAQVGFRSSFVRQENGSLLSAGAGCACFRVLSGRPRPCDEAWRSPNGSLFCNGVPHCAARLGPGPTAGDSLPCVLAGYQSLAQVPIFYAGQLVGTIHLADRRAGQFPLHAVLFLETVAPLIGEALHRFAVEISLSQSEARFRSMFERHDAVMLLVELESGAIADANPAAAAFYGYSRERLREMNIGDLNELPTGILKTYRRRVASERRFSHVVSHRLANGRRRTVEVYGSLIEVQNRPLVFAIVHDITERKLLEKAILEIGEKERQQVGHDLHDSLGSKLSGAALMGKALAQQLAANAAPEAALAEEVVECINQSIRQTRTIAHGLCPVELASGGLGVALEELAEETRRLPGISCRFETQKALEAPDRFRSIHLFRIAQEAVSNALCHGAARRITLRLSQSGKRTCLEISDDGAGLAGQQPSGNGLGLRSMKYRAAAIGGQLTVECNPRAGTTVRCVVAAGAAPPVPATL